MAFVSGLDTRSANVLGSGAPVGIMEQQVFYLPSGEIDNYDPYAVDSKWIRIKASELKTSEKTNTTPYYDQYDEVGVKQGRVESTWELSQDYYGLTENILQLKNQELWFAEGLQDDRVLKDSATGKPIFQEVNFYRAKMVDFTMDKGDVFKVTGTGKYNTQSTFTVIKGITPVNVLADGLDTTSSGTNYTLTVTATDMYGEEVDLSDLTNVDLANEITAINVTKVSGTPTFTVASSGNIKTLTFNGAGQVVLNVEVVTKNGGTFSATKNVTVS